MVFTLIVATDACIKSVAAIVLDGDDVERRVPVGALCEGCHREAVDCGRI